MKIGNSMVVEIHYTLKNDAGDVMDSSEGREPLAYLHGAQNIVEGLEDALDELEADAEFEVVVPPKTGYGERDERLVGEVPKENFPTDIEVEVGMQFVSETPEGPRPIFVKEIKDEVIIVDGNHELAGKNLHFTGKVVSIREATQEECAHGHPHVEGGCGHDH